MIFTANGSSLEYAQEHTVRICILYVQESQIFPTISFFYFVQHMRKKVLHKQVY